MGRKVSNFVFKYFRVFSSLRPCIGRRRISPVVDASSFSMCCFSPPNEVVLRCGLTFVNEVARNAVVCSRTFKSCFCLPENVCKRSNHRGRELFCLTAAGKYILARANQLTRLSTRRNEYAHSDLTCAPSYVWTAWVTRNNSSNPPRHRSKVYDYTHIAVPYVSRDQALHSYSRRSEQGQPPTALRGNVLLTTAHPARDQLDAQNSGAFHAPLPFHLNNERSATTTHFSQFNRVQ